MDVLKKRKKEINAEHIFFYIYVYLINLVLTLNLYNILAYSTNLMYTSKAFFSIYNYVYCYR